MIKKALFSYKGAFDLFLGKALIYGATLEAYSFINGLLQSGLPGEQIIFVQPPFDDVSCFNNPKIEQLVHNALKDQGITIIYFYDLGALVFKIPLQYIVVHISSTYSHLYHSSLHYSTMMVFLLISCTDAMLSSWKFFSTASFSQWSLLVHQIIVHEWVDLS